MRYHQCIPNHRNVYQEAQELLFPVLPWRDHHNSLTVRDILDMLLLMTVTCRTLSHIVRCFFAISEETARQAIYSQLSDREALTNGLVTALFRAADFTRLDRKRLWTVAIDDNQMPYYGSTSTPGIRGGKKKQGTSYFYTYATAALIHKRRRYVIGIVAVVPGMKPHQVVEILLNQIRSKGLRIGGVVLDSGYSSGETLLLLQRRGHFYATKLQRQGGKNSRRNQLFQQPSGTVTQDTWKTESTRQEVTTSVLVWRSRGQSETRVYAFSGWSVRESVSIQRRAWLARRRYRERFGIETSYRQKNQGRAWTTSKNPLYRLLLEGLSYLIRQLWVRMTLEIALRLGLKPTAWVRDLMYVDLLEIIADNLKAELREIEEKLQEILEENATE